MELTRENVRKQSRKKNLIKWLEGQPQETRFYPNSPCRCMYGQMFEAQFGDGHHFELDFDNVEVDSNRADPFPLSTFADLYQHAACRYVARTGLGGFDSSITRDEAIAIAKETHAYRRGRRPSPASICPARRSRHS